MPPAIGVASAIGTFLVNSVQVEGNSNLFDGAEVRTSQASSRIFLRSGTSLVLGANSAGAVFHDRMLLQQGAAKVDNMDGFAIDTADYRVTGAQAAAQAIVGLKSESVEIAALNGSLNVFDRGGALLTHVGSGAAVAFQTGASPRSSKRGAATPNVNTHVRVEVVAGLLIGASLAGLGYGLYTISQSSGTSR